jgi:hypothetical protein
MGALGQKSRKPDPGGLKAGRHYSATGHRLQTEPSEAANIAKLPTFIEADRYRKAKDE